MKKLTCTVHIVYCFGIYILLNGIFDIASGSACIACSCCCATPGLGSGVSAALFADIARVTSSDERTAVMSVFMAVRQMGLLFGTSRY